jgi:hypothetical protein
LILAIVVNPLEKKPAKYTSVHWSNQINGISSH